MGTDTKGFIPLPKSKKDAFKIVYAMETAIQNLMKAHPEAIIFAEEKKKQGHLRQLPWNIRVKDGKRYGFGDVSNSDEYYAMEQLFSYPRTEFCHIESRMVSCQFIYNGEKRDLKVFFDCDHDYFDSTGVESKVIFDLSCWGSSVEIIHMVTQAVAEKMGAKNYYTIDNDCSDEWVKDSTIIKKEYP